MLGALFLIVDSLSTGIQEPENLTAPGVSIGRLSVIHIEIKTK